MSTPLTSSAPPAPKKKRDWRPLWLVGPSMALLAVVIGYPVLRAIYLSFLADKHINPETGRFVTGGFAGLQHYLYWLSNRCMSPSGQVMECANGQLSTDFWPALKITLFFVVVTAVSMATSYILGTIFRLKKSQRFVATAALCLRRLTPLLQSVRHGRIYVHELQFSPHCPDAKSRRHDAQRIEVD